MTIAYLALLALVGMGRLAELRISRRNQRQLEKQGVHKVAEPHFRLMVILHGGILIAAAAEVLILRRPFIPALAISMGVLFVLANLLRWWVIRALAGHWNVEVMASSRVGVVRSGPYRWIRHPNYVAVVVEQWHGPPLGSCPVEPALTMLPAITSANPATMRTAGLGSGAAVGARSTETLVLSSSEVVVGTANGS